MRLLTLKYICKATISNSNAAFLTFLQLKLFFLQSRFFFNFNMFKVGSFDNKKKRFVVNRGVFVQNKSKRSIVQKTASGAI